MFRKEFQFPRIPQPENDAPNIQASKAKKKAKHHVQEQIKKRWEEKPPYRKYPKRMDEKDVDQHMTNKRLKKAELNSKTEGFIIAAQDQAIKTNYYQHAGYVVLVLPPFSFEP